MKVRDPQAHYEALVAALDQAIEGLTAARKLAILLAAAPPRRRSTPRAPATRRAARTVGRLVEVDPFERAFHEGVRVHPRPTEELSATVHEAAGLLGVGEEQVRRLLRDGVLVGIPYGGRRGWRIPRRHLEEFAAERGSRERELATV